MSKRQFPYFSAVDELHIQKRQATVAGINPGIAKVAPRVFEGQAQHTNQVLGPPAMTKAASEQYIWTKLSTACHHPHLYIGPGC